MPSPSLPASDRDHARGVGVAILVGEEALSTAKAVSRVAAPRFRHLVELAEDVGPRVRRRAFDEGLLGGDPGWSIVGAVAYAFQFIRWMRIRDLRKVVIDDLKPGETLMIEHVEAEPSRRQLRKQARKQAKRDKKAASKTKKDHAQAHAAAAEDQVADAVAVAKADIANLKKVSRRSRRKTRRADKKAGKAAAKQAADEARAAHKAQRRRARRKAAKLQRKADKLERKAAKTRARADV